MFGFPWVAGDGMPGKNVQRKLGLPAKFAGCSRTAKASRISQTVKSRCAREWAPFWLMATTASSLGTLGTRFGGIKPGADLDANTWTAAIRKADVLKGARFNELIALGAWGTEFHSAETMDSVFKLPGGNGVYEIPLGAVTSVDTANLFAAGRTGTANFHSRLP